MCDAGRIRHHLKHNLWRKECTVVFAGYQAEGTIGRSLIDGNKTVRLFGETIDVEAHIEVLHDISGHADRDGLIEWACGFQKKPQQYFIVHAAMMSATALQSWLHKRRGLWPRRVFRSRV